MSIIRYRYRVYPTGAQAAQLARTFGCARVVFNDCLRIRQDSHAVGEKVSDTEVQRRAVTAAKATEARAWLSEVASVALVQACGDAHHVAIGDEKCATSTARARASCGPRCSPASASTPAR